MKIIITKTGRRHYYYEKGDIVKDITTNGEYTVDRIDVQRRKIIDTFGNELDISINIRPTTDTLKNAKIEDRRVAENEASTKEILFAPLRPDAKIPSKNEEDGWYDVYACFDEEYILISPHTCVLVPTGIMSAFNKKYRVSLGERGSTGTRLIEVRAGKIDSGYRGEWFVALSNGGNKDIIIAKGIDKVVEYNDRIEYPYSKAICQAELNEVPSVQVVVTTPEKLKAITSIRGEGMLGSSNK